MTWSQLVWRSCRVVVQLSLRKQGKTFRVSKPPAHKLWKSDNSFHFYVLKNVGKISFNCQFWTSSWEYKLKLKSVNGLIVHCTGITTLLFNKRNEKNWTFWPHNMKKCWFQMSSISTWSSSTKQLHKYFSTSWGHITPIHAKIHHTKNSFLQNSHLSTLHHII